MVTIMAAVAATVGITGMLAAVALGFGAIKQSDEEARQFVRDVR